jgi:hypothetical protein
MRYFRPIVAVALLLFAINASAQTTTGSLSGSVIDAQDQVVPGADVVLTNQQTQEVRRTVTNAIGLFEFPGLQPGPYTVRAELSGFRPYEQRDNQVLANIRLALPPIRLEVGTLAEAVTVSAVGEVVGTTQTSHQAVLDLKQVENLSIRGRDPMSLLKILPGVQLLANDNETVGGGFNSPVPSLQGGQGQTVYVDGINGGDGGGGGALSGTTVIDAIAEVNVQMSAYTAEYGLKGGSQINVITKHGGAEYHGTGYWYRRHEMWNSTNYFNKINNRPKPQYRYSNLGGTLGGPIPKVKGINPDGNKLFFFYVIDDTQAQRVNPLRFYRVPTALERAGDFSQSVRPNGTLVVVTDPTTGQPFPGNRIPTNRIDSRGQAFLNLFPLPNEANVNAGANYLTQEDSIDWPRRQHMFRGDWRPTDRDSLAVKYQTFYTRSVGVNVDGASARWGLVRQRYDFDVDIAKIDYTRILNSSTILEFSTGFFNSVENGPQEDDTALAGIQRATYPQINRLGQLAGQHNPLGLIPQVLFGNIPTADRNASNSGADAGGPAQVQYDGRWPIYGNDIAINAAINLTHTRGRHTYKMGFMREDELFGQARSGVFGGEFNFADDTQHTNRTGYAYANALLGQVRGYRESLGRVPDDRRQRTWAWYVQDTFKVTQKLTLDYGLRMYKWGPNISQGGEASAFSEERFDPRWGGNPPVFFQPVLVGTNRLARNPVTGQTFPASFIGNIVPGTGYTCNNVITAQTPCSINGMVTQRDGNYLEGGGEGFVEPVPLQLDPRFGMAYAPNQRTVIRAAVGSFHDGTGGYSQQQGDGNAAYRFTKQVLYTDLDSYLLGNSFTTPVANSGGPLRTNNRRQNNIRYTAGFERELGKNIVVDAAYVGSYSTNVSREQNINILPAGVRFLASSRDLTRTPTATDPASLPDAMLRPILGYSDINIADSVGWQRYNSLQLQVTRRFTGRFEMAGSYTWARGYEDELNEQVDDRTQRRDIQEHVLVTSYQYEIPKASSALGNSAPVRWILDDWRLSGISTFGTGGRGRVSASYSPAADYSGGGQVCGGYTGTNDRDNRGVNPFNIVGDLQLSGGDQSVDRWFATENVQPVTRVGDRGNEGACTSWQFTMPGWHNHDLTLFKEFRFKGNQTLQYRWEIYNIFDQVQFQDVNVAATFNPTNGAQTNANFGKITSARTERRMQMSLRYTF